MKKYDVICIGELIIDMISQEPGRSLSEAENFSKFAGGAPANVAVGLANFDRNVAFIGRVGDDSFGKYLRQKMEKHSINTDYLIAVRGHSTRLAYVSIDEQGERSFEFLEKSPADLALMASDISQIELNQSKVIHFGSLGLADTKARKEFIKILNVVNSTDTLISFDPNYRSSLWKSESEAYRVLNAFAAKAHILKMDIEEAKFLCNCHSTDEILKSLTFKTSQIVAITMGENGCILKNRKYSVKIPGFKVNVVDSTGCGDAFMAALIDGIISFEKTHKSLSEEELYTIGTRANAAGAIAATRYGAMSNPPTRSEIDQFIKSEIY
ncbi:MAG: carbohydrate kinase [Candidatus Marinimicrobia bacterium]|nr:carbohydrate kinase [Candidatus Neomarinimicrobiota bacterium]